METAYAIPPSRSIMPDDAEFARRALAAKTPPEQVVYMLVGRGLVEPQARSLVEATQNARGTARSGTANMNLVVGIIMVVVGLIITVVSYSAASDGPGGGTYFIMYGPIIFGIMRIVRGLAGRR